MTPAELLRRVRELGDPDGPATVRLTEALRVRSTWYRTEKEHWIGWLRDYDGPGAYGRKGGERDAAYAYGHVQCPTMLLWLAEAAGVPAELLERAVRAVLAATNCRSQCGALRGVIPWSEVRRRLDVSRGKEKV